MEGPEFSCEDMEFFATWDEVTVIPNYSGDKLSCICVRFAPAAFCPLCAPTCSAGLSACSPLYTVPTSAGRVC